MRGALEVADIFRTCGPAWRSAQRAHLSLSQLKVMSAIEQCRSAALGGHVLRCEGCGADQIAYNSCRNRHCPKCQASAAARWLEDRQAADLLAGGVLTTWSSRCRRRSAPSPTPTSEIVYGLLFEVAAAHATQHGRRPQAPGSPRSAITAGAAHLGSSAHAPPARARHRARRRSRPRRRSMGRLPPGLLPVRCACSRRLFRRQFLEQLATGASRRAAALLRASYATLADPALFAPLAHAAAQDRMGRVRQAPVFRAAGGARLPVALHPPGGHLQPAAARLATSATSPSGGRTIGPRDARATRP